MNLHLEPYLIMKDFGNFLFQDPKYNEKPSAWIQHIPFAFFLIEKLQPKIFVELGTHYGNSYFAFCQAVDELKVSSKTYAVDLWKGDKHAGYYSDEVFDYVNHINAKHFMRFSNLMRMSFEEALSFFNEGTIDLLHIDGLHTYEAVKHDFDSWLPKMSSKGVIIMHDTNVRERDFGVWKLFEELKSRYPFFEFTHGHGLGLLCVGEDVDESFLQTLKNFFQESFIRNLFASLGEKIEVKRNVELINRELIKKDHELVRSLETNKQKIDQLDQMNEQLKQKSEEINQKNGELNRKNAELHQKEEELSHKNAELHQMEEALSHKNAELHQMEETLSHKNAELNQTNGELNQKNQIIHNIISSKSWRLIELVRNKYPFIVNFFKKILLLRRIFRPSHGRYSDSANSISIDRNDYTEWIHQYDTLTDQDRANIKSRINQLSKTPLISVIMPVYNPNPEYLIEAIQSVQNQIYTNWELCIADDASTDSRIRPVLENFAQKDDRIKVVFREENGHISACSNSALELASGEWVALFDHDDKLAEHALYRIAETINRNPDVKLLYSDEDKIDEKGNRSEPYFKSDWNLDLFYSQNMFSHLGVYNNDLLKKIGGFRKGVEGSQDYDLVLRCIEHIDSKQIIHIPGVLYHWRIHPDSTAKSGDTKPYAFLAGQKALDEHFKRQGINAKTELLNDIKSYRVRYDLPKEMPLVSLIILTRNKLSLLNKCIDSILTKTTYQNYEILIVDNGSDEPETLQFLKEIQSNPKVRVIRDNRPFNFSALNNAAVKIAQGEIIGLLNNDIEVISPDWLTEMVSHALQPEVGAVGARLWYPNDTLQHGGVVIGAGGVAGHSHLCLPRGQHGYFARASLIQNYSAVTAACLVIQKSIYEKVGGLNEENLTIAFNDIDFCLRVFSMGYRNIWTPFAELYHHESATRGYEDTPEKQKRFSLEVDYMQQQWEWLLLNDPAYNPNLSLQQGDFSLAWPPRVKSL